MVEEDWEEIEKKRLADPHYVEVKYRSTLHHMDQDKYAFEKNFQLTKELIHTRFEDISAVLDEKYSGSIAVFVIASKDEFSIQEILESILWNTGWNKDEEDWAKEWLELEQNAYNLLNSKIESN